MPDPLPEALIDLLREMRASGVSINGLAEATGLSRITIVKYTSSMIRPRGRSIGDRRRKWTSEADSLLRTEYPLGMTTADLAVRVNAILGRDEITAHAVAVRIGKLGIKRDPGMRRTDDISAARREYWARWRAGLVVHRRCTATGGNQ